jgi:hypothetical protein
MAIPIRAIARAVEKAGGDMDDVDDLVAVWKRLDADRSGRVDQLRRANATVRCCCAGSHELANDSRCPQCQGVPR